MDHHTSTTAARVLLTLTVLPTALLVPTIAAADTAAHPTKAQVEHAERESAATAHPTKAQVEYAERQSGATAQVGHAEPAARPGTPSVSTSGSGDAAAWQLALSAAVGALVTGAAMVAGRRLGEHPRALVH